MLETVFLQLLGLHVVRISAQSNVVYKMGAVGS